MTFYYKLGDIRL